MSGALILISGISGAGKTILMRAAAEGVPNLEILQTTTTRPIREGEVNGQEYMFVSDAEYESLRATAARWDHLDYHGYKYGADATAIIAKLQRGTNIICTITPEPEEITILERAYGVKAKTIWLNVPPFVAAQRVAGDKLRANRTETMPAISHFQHIFTPKGELEADKTAFVELITNLLA